MAKNSAYKSYLPLLKKAFPFNELNGAELVLVAKGLDKITLSKGETLFSEKDKGKECYIVSSGDLLFTKMGRPLKHFKPGDFFGEIGMLDERNRMGNVSATEDTELLVYTKDSLDKLSADAPDTAVKIYRGFARLVISYLREETSLYNEFDVLLIQDGGCAPGYNPVTAYLTEFLEKSGHEIFIAAQGFRSVVRNHIEDYRYLIYSRRKYEMMERIAGVVFSPPLRESRGADFRSERYPQFKEKEIQRTAADNILKRKAKIVIGIGGNGTFAGIKALSEFLPEIQFYFLPVTIDSDIFGTECIGQHTGVEVGAEKIRSYLADARTHDRVYFIEMMGADSGYHALHSALGAGAHLAVVPGVDYDYRKTAEAINRRTSAVIVVAEGFAKVERRASEFKGNAAEYFRLLLVQNGLETNRRIVAEPFSRDIRGAAPNNMDISLAQRMAHNLVELINSGRDRVMPATLSGKDLHIPFAEIKTDNTTGASLSHLSNRLY